MNRKIDSHVHLSTPRDIEKLDSIREAVGVDAMSVASIIHQKNVNENPALFAAKTALLDKFYIFPAPDHAAHFTSGAVSAPSMAEQLEKFIAIGADGIKLLESKPAERRMVDIPVDSDYYEGMFALLEETGLPILWHVADPEEFWDPELTPKWAREQGWGYDETWIPKEQYYTEVENVLKRHPKLKATFAHFYFLSADLKRAAALLDRYPGVNFDLALGIEMAYNMSHDLEASREFFIHYSDRILYGTDIWGDMTITEAKSRAGIIFRWLETSDEFRIPKESDFLLGPPEDGIIHGMELPGDVLEKIYRTNFERLAGGKPKSLNKELAIEECRRMLPEIEALEGDLSMVTGALKQLQG